MPEFPDKQDVTRLLKEIAELLDLKGENPFRVRAYANAARAIESAVEDFATLVREERLTELPGVGEGIARNITEFVATGRLALHEQLKAALPEGLMELLRIPGLGPKRVRQLFEQLEITNLGELEYACHENRLLDLHGFGPKSQENILRGIAALHAFRGRHLFAEAHAAAEELAKALRTHPAVRRLELAGSLRRHLETVKDLDLVVASADAPSVMAQFVALDPAAEVVAHGPTKSSLRLPGGLAVDLRVVTDEQFPYALHHFTGSALHNNQMRTRSKRLGLRMNEYGLFRGEENVPCADEDALFAALGLQVIPPELREGAGEIEAAEAGTLPRLLVWDDLKGALHNHTTYSDGTATLGEMAEAAIALGWSWLGIADHSRTAVYAHGLELERIAEQQAEITRLNEQLGGFRLFFGIESEILADGSLDYDEATLARFDYVIASVHSRFKMDQQTMTERILAAVRHPRTSILGHPTGRLLLSREGYAVDLEQVLAACAECGVAVELNANPHRLDLDWRHLRRAKELGVAIAINPDAHSPEGLLDAWYGLGIARKGWLGPADVLNSLPAAELARRLKRG